MMNPMNPTRLSFMHKIGVALCIWNWANKAPGIVLVIIMSSQKNSDVMPSSFRISIEYVMQIVANEWVAMDIDCW